mmetsp:Transcript_4415/g.6431  ORF Transcript_4415/g.6431 Transcript_4415/m.6431 type:complete len:221 (-) Transcript_4415:397-1059(-)
MKTHHRHGTLGIEPKVRGKVSQKLISVYLISIDTMVLPSITDIIRILTRFPTNKIHGIGPRSRYFQGSQCTENPGIGTAKVLFISLRDRTEFLHDTFQSDVVNVVQINTSITPIPFTMSLTIMEGQADSLCNILQIFIEHGGTFSTYVFNYVFPPEMFIPAFFIVPDWIALLGVDSVLAVLVAIIGSSRLPCWFVSWFGRRFVCWFVSWFARRFVSWFAP